MAHRDLRQELEDWDGWPAAWQPEPGDILVGKVLRYSVGEGSFGPVHTCLIEEENTGKRWSLWLSSTVLLRLFQRERPRPGERIGLRYEGKDPEEGYHRYLLLVDREETVPDFHALGGEDCGLARYRTEEEDGIPF